MKRIDTEDAFLSPMTNAQTLVTENDHMMTVSKMSKTSSRMSLRPVTKKNFIAENKKVKTSNNLITSNITIDQDIKQEYS